jgi:hypothetical protein
MNSSREKEKNPGGKPGFPPFEPDGIWSKGHAKTVVGFVHRIALDRN